jgi:hypothetical protein
MGVVFKVSLFQLGHGNKVVIFINKSDKIEPGSAFRTSKAEETAIVLFNV